MVLSFAPREEKEDEDVDKVSLVARRSQERHDDRDAELLFFSGRKMVLFLVALCLSLLVISLTFHSNNAGNNIIGSSPKATQHQQGTTQHQGTITPSVSHTTSNHETQQQDSRMRIMIASGCSGSSATGARIKRILQAHGYQVYSASLELLKPQKNTLYKQAFSDLAAATKQMEDPKYEDVIVETIKRLHHDAVSRGQVLSFKADEGRLLQGGVLAGLQQIGATFVHMYRWNALDRCVCMVRDCFQKTFGYPVYANNGTETDLCFLRRKHPETKVKAYFYKGMAKKCATKERRNSEENLLDFHDIVSPGASVPYEDLFGYSSTADQAIFDRSLSAWVALMSPLMQQVNQTIIRNLLQAERNTRPLPGPHEQVIYNIDQVARELGQSELPLLDQYLRS